MRSSPFFVALYERDIVRPLPPMQDHNSSAEHLSDKDDDNFPLTGRLVSQQRSLWWRQRTCLFNLFPVALLLFLACIAYPSRPEQFEDSRHRSACTDDLEDCRRTGPLIFDSVNSLLKQWPNTYSLNGHSVVIGRVSPNTQLYHAWPDGKPLKVPTFFAFDAYVL
jgi:hypothetical protein